MSARGHWTRGKRRKGIDGCGPLLAGIGSIRAIARAAGVSPRAVSWWLTGKSAPSLEQLWAIIDRLLPRGTGRESAVISGGIAATTLESGIACGVGQYTRRAAAGRPCHAEACDP